LRMEEVREDFARVSRKRAESANLRWGKSKADANAHAKPHANDNANGDAKQDANAHAKPMPSSSSPSSSSSSDSPSKEPPAAAPPAPQGGAAPRRSKLKSKFAVSPDVRKVLAFIEWWKYGEKGGPQLSAPGLIPDRLAEGYTVLECMLAYWRALRRWKEGHNQTSPFRPAHFGVLLDEARVDLAKGWDQRNGALTRGFDDLHDTLKARGLEGEALTAAILKAGWTRDGQLQGFVHFAEHGAWPEEKS